MRKLAMFALGFAALLFAVNVAQAAAAADEDTDNKFTIHGEVRFRGEGWNNLTDFTDTDTQGLFGSSNDSFDIYPYRVRLAAKGELGHDIWVYGEFQASGIAGGVGGEIRNPFGDPTEFFNAVDAGVHLYQGFVKVKDIGDSSLDLTFGRQEIVFDRGLHFSSLDFYNGIRHDGVMAAWDWDRFGIHAFWIRPVDLNLSPVGPVSVASGADNDTLGAHVGWMIGKDKDMDVAAYAFYQIMNATALVPGDDRGKIYTIGGRWGRMIEGKSGFVWNAEASMQFGDFQPCAAPAPFTGACSTSAFDQSAFVFEGAFGYVFHSGDVDHKFWGGYTLASGDDDATDEDNSSFVPLYTDYHNRLGYADLFTISNIQAISAGWKMSINDKHVIGATFWNFSQDNTEAGTVSPLTGVTLAASCTGSSCNDDLGNELDVFYDYHMTENFSFDTALSWFSSGDAIEDNFSSFGAFAGGDDAGWRLTAQARARF